MHYPIFRIALATALLGIMPACSDFLSKYSQNLTIPKTPEDLNELLVGGVDGYLPSVELVDNNVDQIGSWFNILDDDINGVIAPTGLKTSTVMRNFYFGYTTWQLEVGRNFVGNALAADDQVWKSLYHRINVANMVLKQLDEVTILTPQDQSLAQKVRAEEHFLRAQFYLILANLYAPAYNPSTAANDTAVPLKLTEYVEYDKAKDVQFPRASLAQVYTQIEKDLLAAIEAFKIAPQNKAQYRASLPAAQLLLSRVYLYMQRWKEAQEWAQQLLSYKPELLDFRSLGTDGIALTNTSPELIFSQGSLCLQNAISGYGNDFCVSDDLYRLYTDTDLRKGVYFERNVTTDSIALGRKYRMGTHRSYVSDAFTLRTAEAYLNAAEASAMLGEDQQAQAYLNHLRSYRLTGDYQVLSTGDELIADIRDERRRELCFEGHRWFDLRRYAVNAVHPYSKSIVRVFPIYDDESSNLYQNTRLYVLDIDDPAYQMQLPASIINKEPKQVVNARLKREFTLLPEASDSIQADSVLSETDSLMIQSYHKRTSVHLSLAQ